MSIRGTAKIERYNPKTRMARAKIIESLDVIERGAKIGPVGRKFDVVPPVRSDVDLEASILAAVYPNSLLRAEPGGLHRSRREGRREASGCASSP